jgi:hypothetical protein
VKQRIFGTGRCCQAKWRRKLIYGNNLLVLLYCKNGDKDGTLVLSSCFRTLLKMRAFLHIQFLLLFWIIFFCFRALLSQFLYTNVQHYCSVTRACLEKLWLLVFNIINLIYLYYNLVKLK